jgi:hypothetical protein
MTQQRHTKDFAIIIITAATLLPAACKRREASPGPAPTEEATAAAELPRGACLETNVLPAKAPACMACLKRNSPTGKPPEDGCCGVRDAVGQQLCRAVATCIRAGGPPVGLCNVDGDVTTCYCGKHQVGCDQPGKADGPCVAQITAAAGRDLETQKTDTPTPAQILERYGLVKYALGRATNIAALAGGYCKTECGIGM